MPNNRKIIDGEIYLVVDDKRMCLYTIMRDKKY